MTNRVKNNGCAYITQNDLSIINAALQEGVDVRIKTIPNGVKILKEKPEPLMVRTNK